MSKYYNLSGVFSHLPLNKGDRAVVLLGIRKKPEYKSGNLDYIAPGLTFWPLYVPIRGIYNGYSANNLMTADKSVLTENLEKHFFFNKYNIDELIDIAERSECGINRQDNDLEAIWEYLYNNIDDMHRNDEFGFVIEHEEIYNTLVSMSKMPLLKVKIKDIESDLLQKTDFDEELAEFRNLTIEELTGNKDSFYVRAAVDLHCLTLSMRKLGLCFSSLVINSLEPSESDHVKFAEAVLNLARKQYSSLS